ncbi:MAG: ArsR family transcriptional regulator [Candidatus Bathyarchaeota archaeon]|nr:ArsR family transcriptional regulator [Candidatus Bathyarchaeota archaeon]
MSHSRRLHGVKVLKAISSSIRLRILNLLFDKGPLSYTELMSSLKMNPSRDAGRFAYHLKFLLKADLIEADVEAKKYCLTELGKIVIDVADEIAKKAFKPRKMLVRTSHSALEEFDANKITDSLTKEANMPAELAQKVAKEVEKRLLKSKTKYLTAPLVREVVNAVLIEKGLEEYRHKLTRLGLPVYDVSTLVETKSKASQGSASIHETAGEIVLKEYMLLNIFPRDIADANLSGLLHINGLSYWVLKPSEIMHDLRFFFKNGLNLEKINAFQPSYPPPKSLDSALSATFNVLLHSAKEVGEAQTLDYFNVFLAPFVKDIETSKVKEAFRLFISNINQHVASVSLGLELAIPDFMAEKQAIGPFGKRLDNYGDFTGESQLIASLLFEIFAEESVHKPLLNPRIIVKICPETFVNEKAKTVLLQAHRLAGEKGIPYFANLLGKTSENSVFSASGFRLRADLMGDWEIDILRTGSLGCVTINLPRIAYESKRDETKFFEILKERLEMATRALEIKHRALKQNGKGLLPFLMQNVDGDQYFRLEYCSRLINLVGLKEAAEAFHGKNIYDDGKALEFAQQITQHILAFTRKIGKRRGKRLTPALLPSFKASERLAQLDIERYGIAKVRFSGTREKPFYSTVSKLTLQDGEIPQEFLKVERKLRGLHAGGCLTVIELGKVEHNPDELMSLTKQIVENYGIEFFTYDRQLTYCVNCKRSWFGLLHKCPSCGATSTLTVFNRFTST